MIKLVQISNISGLLLMLTLNALANTLPINGMNTGELSDLYPNLFVPAGLTFSIWGLIYLLLIGFTIMQAKGLFSNSNSAPVYVGQIKWLFVLNGMLNAGWIVAWHFQLVLPSLFIMLGLLITLILIYERIGRPTADTNLLERIFVYGAFSIYLGWICIATIANFTTLLVDLKWDGFGISEAIWTVLVILIGTGVNLFFMFKRSDLVLPLVGIWAFIGITLKRSQVEPQVMLVLIAATGCAALLAFLFMAKSIQGR